MPRRHTIAAGETFATLAAEHGFARGAQIYDHPDNTALREQRDNPDVLAVGDVVAVPDPAPRSVEIRVGAAHRFRVVRPRHHLRLQPMGCRGEPLDGRNYVLELETIRFEGVVQGRIEHCVPLGTRRGRLEICGTDEEPALVWALEVGHLEPAETAAGLQARLNNLGFCVGTVDADVGPKTEAGLRRFQEAHGLDPDGRSSAEVLDRLREAYGC